MDNWHQRLKGIQQSLRSMTADGWLLYDFRRNNDLACRFLAIPPEALLTRRFFYWIPNRGTPLKIVHKIENQSLNHLPGKNLEYGSWEELEKCLASVLKGRKTALMEYSPNNAIPTVSKVDAGTVDLIRRLRVKIKSSADLLQEYTSTWTDRQLQLHQAAAKILQKTVEKAWQLIASAVRAKQQLTEIDVQQFILKEFKKNHCVCSDPPICAVNAHSANPHYTTGRTAIRRNDFVLIDAWCKKNLPNAVYADITRVCVAAAHPTQKQQEIFTIVREARDAALRLLQERLKKGKPVKGWEVDQVCRRVIVKAGYSDYFPHRTGHNIGEQDHGDGANIDNFETREERLLLPRTCFSIEPGIYLPGKFGVRLEDNVFIGDKSLHLTPGMQNEIACLL